MARGLDFDDPSRKAISHQVADVHDAAKPMKQSTIRRMTVKGKTVYVRDTFTAPVK